MEQKSPPLGDLGGQEIWKQKRKADEKTWPLQTNDRDYKNVYK
jgi:hypothetical protein